MTPTPETDHMNNGTDDITRDPVETNGDARAATGYAQDSGSPRDSEGSVPCAIDGCERVFKTTRGAGQHRRRAHPNEIDAKLAERNRGKRRVWTAQEDQLLVDLASSGQNIDTLMTRLD